ncbi:MAG TPA: hypothetical protein VFD69_13050 [Vicinamibacterales bacterium]|nr:hypothetical protein [Vicinamibacterales bacterium]
MSLAELLVASGVLLAVTAVAGTAAMRAQLTFRTQPEVADMQQRARVAAAAVGRDLLMAGAGPASTAFSGPLVRRFPPIAPYRRGQTDDARAGVFYRPGAMSVVYVPDTRAEADVVHAFDLGRELLVDLAPNCGVVVHERVCGFTAGMRVVLFDGRGAFDLATVVDVASDRVRVQHDGGLSSTYDGGAVMAEVMAPTYIVRPDAAGGALQLVRYDGFRTDRPMIDNVVDARFEYFGDPAPPRPLPPAAAADPPRPSTSYGPAPPSPDVDDPRDLWGAGENCLFADAEGPVPRLGQIAAGPSPILLDPARFQDGPWCPDAAHAVRFDADLLRIRRVRLRLRVQVAVAAMRGPAGRLFARGGTSTSPELFAPDQQIVLDVTPRNLAVAP